MCAVEDSEPTLLYCIGATKAGTSWLFRTLSSRNDCALSAVKESHYWDTLDRSLRVQQITKFKYQRVEFQETLEKAREADRGWQVRNFERRISDLDRLIEMLKAPFENHEAYLDYLVGSGEPGVRLLGDICPSYALLPEERFKEMASLSETSRFVYLIRDPLARLWSAIRMQAERQLAPGQVVDEKANNTLWRILKRDAEQHIILRGDYSGTITRLRAALPESQIRIVYMEELFTDAGYGDLCEFLRVTRQSAPIGEKVHEGRAIEMRHHLRREALEYLFKQYDFVAREVGNLPKVWLENMEEILS